MSRTRIVAVDDDRRILRVIKRSCESFGYEVHAVLDAEFFESTFRVFEPALVFLDLNMRHIDGIELLRFMAAERTETSVIVTSGVDDRLLAAAHTLGMSLGLDMLDPVRKPLMLADLRRRLVDFVDPSVRDAGRAIGEATLREAMGQGLLDVYYQPMVDLASGGVVGVEALARLRRPGAGIVMPGQFIPVAEQCGLIHELTSRVLDRAVADLLAWSAVAPDLQVAVNLSPLLLTDDELPQRIATVLERHAIAPSRLVIEVTETRAPDDRQRMAQTLGRLRAHGVRLALDDFGTGFCSLGQLYEFPYETLKLDRKFAMRAHADAEAAAMIHSSLELARSVGLRVVAEGIQSEETLCWLARMGCHVGQGFHISPPLSSAALGAWLARPDPGVAFSRAPMAVAHLDG